MQRLMHPLEVDCHLKTKEEIAEKLNISVEEVINWRRYAPPVLQHSQDPDRIIDPEEDKPVANPPIPEKLIGPEGKEHYHLISDAVFVLGFDKNYKNPQAKIRGLLKQGLLDGFDACTLLDPNVKKEDAFPTCYWIYHSSIEAYRDRYLNKF